MKLISTFVFATQIIQSLFFLNPKFQASSHLLWLYSPVCVRPGQNPRRLVFSQRGSNYSLPTTQTKFCLLMSRYVTLSCSKHPPLRPLSSPSWRGFPAPCPSLHQSSRSSCLSCGVGYHDGVVASFSPSRHQSRLAVQTRQPAARSCLRQILHPLLPENCKQIHL